MGRDPKFEYKILSSTSTLQNIHAPGSSENISYH